MLILDWDVHHGNGTNDIFHADPSVLFVSIHESPLYPGTGPASDVGSGPGAGFTVNLPVPGGSGDAVHGSLVEHVVAPLVRGWEPELVLLSAGFDAHAADPLASCTLSEAGFAGMTASMRRACAAVGAPIGLVLEGGYSVPALAGSMAAVVPVLGADAVPDAAEPAVHPLARDARRAARRVLARSVRVDAADVGVLGVDAVERGARLGLRVVLAGEDDPVAGVQAARSRRS